MIDEVLSMKKQTFFVRVKYKTLVSAMVIALAIVIPQLIHMLLGTPGGVKWLPMYFPVLVGGCLLGKRWGIATGLLSPLFSFLITTLLGNSMPIAIRLPFMMIELAVFAAVAGFFAKKIVDNGLWAFPAVILAQISGRSVFLGIVAILQNITPFSFDMILGQIRIGIPGILLQVVLVPLIIMLLRKVLLKDEQND